MDKRTRKISTTPSSTWHQLGEPDPHFPHYDCERQSLSMGWLTDDELANAVYLNYDVRPPLVDIIAGKAYSPIAWVTSAKDRIRWLSRALEKELAKNRDLETDKSRMSTFLIQAGYDNWEPTPEEMKALIKKLQRGLTPFPQTVALENPEDCLDLSVVEASQSPPTLYHSPTEDEIKLGRMVKYLMGCCVSGFHEDFVPSYTQGYPTHELQSLVTASEVSGLVSRVQELSSKITELEKFNGN